MGKVVKKIVLTGGPSSGKSSSLKIIKDYFDKNGYKVYIIGESATELMSSGLVPKNDDKKSMIEFQDILLKYQLFKENLILESINNSNDDNAIVIFDRGLLDNKAYIGDSEFNELLGKYKLKEMELLNRYDLIIHLETGAKSDFYRTDNNEYRRESKEEAIEMDNKTLNAWKLHRNLHIVKCYDDFSLKQERIINICKNSLKDNKRKQYKYIVDDSTFNEKIDSSYALIEQYYIDNNDKYEHRLRKLISNNQTVYSYTIQEKLGDGFSNIILDEIIPEQVFNLKLVTKKIINTVNKKRYYIIVDGVLLYLDIFNDGRIIIESNNKNFDYNRFKIISDVTSDDGYLNINITNNEKRLEKSRN